MNALSHSDAANSTWRWSFPRSLAAIAKSLFNEYDLHAEQRYDDELGDVEHMLHEVGHAYHSHLELGEFLSTRIAWHLSERYFRNQAATITLARRSEAFALGFTWQACQLLGIEELDQKDFMDLARDQGVEDERIRLFLRLARPRHCAQEFVALLTKRMESSNV